MLIPQYLCGSGSWCWSKHGVFPRSGSWDYSGFRSGSGNRDGIRYQSMSGSGLWSGSRSESRFGVSAWTESKSWPTFGSRARSGSGV